MQKQIQLGQRPVEYTLKISRRARRMRLAVYCDGNFVVTAPRRLSENLIERFIRQKSHWIISKLEYFKNFSGPVPVKRTRKDYLIYKSQARQLARERLEHFNQLYGFKYQKINIKNQRTRWGSCSKKGNLNFNYKIALLPAHLADYIIVHELCHLKEFNHSSKFWTLVGQAIPDCFKLRRELRKQGLLI